MSDNTNIVTNVIWKFAERILAEVITLIVSIVLARLLLPSDYGAISMVTVFITIANVFVTNGIPAALVQKKQADNQDFSSVLYLNLLISSVLYVALFLFAPAISDFYDYPALTPVIRVMGLRLIIGSMASIQEAYVARNMLFRKFFWSTLGGSLVSGVVGVAMAFTGFGVWALVAQYMLTTTVSVVIMWVVLDWKPVLCFSWTSVKALFSYGWKILVEGLSNTVVGQLNNLIIGKVYTSDDLAYYTKAAQFPNLIVTNICSAISSVLFSAMSAKQDKKDDVKLLLRQSVQITTYVVFPMLVGLGVVAPQFICVLLTDKWIDCVPYLQIYCLLNIAQVGMYPRHQALKGTGRSDVFMYEHMLSRVIGIFLLIIVYRISVMAIAVSGIVSTAILTLTVMYTSKRYNGYGYREQIADVMPTVLGCVVMAVPVLLIGTLNLPSLVVLILQVLFGAAAYITYSILFKLQEFATIMRYARNLFGKHRQ